MTYINVPIIFEAAVFGDQEAWLDVHVAKRKKIKLI